ncbi:copper uptake system-associated protein [Chitinilyticum aquatile]|uniref:copper uptake system-associated protein n=1 Tax=Chitinilyticum aquatile TaxID=362520 RepID=UPI0003F9E7C8|nr:copper uptake system-associated protein [Chitinilyticum aquatile]
MSALLLPAALACAEHDEMAIVAHMKSVWEKPDAPLTVKPVVTLDGFGIAGWLQGARGGRAILQKGEHGWQTLLCAGTITNRLLEQAGASPATAKALLAELGRAEQELTAGERAQLASFQRVVHMDKGGQHHGHEAHGKASAASTHAAQH